MRIGIFATRIPCLLVACLLVVGSGCRNLDASSSEPLKTPPKGLAPMKRIDGSKSGGRYSPAELF